MRWIKKLLLPSLVVLLSLFVSVFGLEKQASAAYVSRNITGLTTNDVSFTRQGDSASGVFVLEFADHPSYTSSLRNYRFTNLGFTFNSSLSSDNQNGIYLDFYILVSDKGSASSELNTMEFSAAGVCPSINPNNYQDRYSITECSVETISRETFVTQFQTDYYSASGIAYDELSTINYSETFFYIHYQMKAYINSDSSVSTTSFSLYGPFLQIFSNRNFANLRLTVLTAYATSGYPINRQTAEEKMNDKDDEDRQNLENQTSETESDANEQGAAAESTGTSLLGVFSSFVSSLAQIHETNCLLPTISVYGLDLGRLDLCTFDVPPGIIALATVGMIFIIVPLSFHLARRLINIFRSFQG